MSGLAQGILTWAVAVAVVIAYFAIYGARDKRAIDQHDDPDLDALEQAWQLPSREHTP